MRYWLTPPIAAQFAAKVADVCPLYRDAPTLAERGARVLRRDERTGGPALERKQPGRPLGPGTVARRAVAYIRHGTRACLLSRDVVSGQVVAPSCGPTGAAAAWLAQVRGGGAPDAAATRWHFVVDNLDIHPSASLVRWVAAASGVADLDLGPTGKTGILATRPPRMAFLSDPSHRIGFHDTPKHRSGLTQIEIGLSILVRKLRKRGSFTSVDDRRQQVLALIAYDNRTMAQPFTWTYQGNALALSSMAQFPLSGTSGLACLN